jgi:hypothetical protein
VRNDGNSFRNMAKDRAIIKSRRGEVGFKIYKVHKL